MSWFKCLAPDHPIMEDIFNTFGAEGYGYACIAINQAFLQKVFKIDVVRLGRWLNIRSPKAQKLLPFFQKLLADYEQITKQSGRNPVGLQSDYSVIGAESDQITSVTTPSNPHGSTRDQEENRKEKKRREGRRVPPLPPQANFENLPTDYQPILTFINSTTKERISEVDLLRRDCIQLINSSRVARINLLGESLQEFCECNPTAKNMVYAWLKHPPAVRMAAIAYAFTCPHKANQFDWALKAIKGDWESYQKFIPACQLMVDAGDYTLEV